MAMITQDELKKILYYNPETGVFTWLVSTAHRVKIGDVAGTLSSDGYVQITIKGERYLAHRLAWLYEHGNFPTNHIDHINGIRKDNRPVNLREATNAENGHNKGIRADNTSGFKGVSWDKSRSKWQARCGVGSKNIYLGRFNTPEEASEAYQSSAKEHHKEFYNNGIPPTTNRG